MRFFLHLLVRHLLQFPGRALVAMLALGAAATLMLGLGSAGAGLRWRLGGYLEEIFPEERMQLEAKRGGFGPLAAELKPITPETLRRVEARPEVEHVWPVEPVRFPVRVEGNLFGNTISSDAVIHGMARELITDALPAGADWSGAGEPYPLVVSNFYLDVYNLGLAPSSGMPLLNPGYVLGKHVTLVLGESAVGLGTSTKPPRAVRVRVAGISRNPAMLGLALPAEVVRGFNAEYAAATPIKYVQLIALLRPGADRAEFLSAMDRDESLALARTNAIADQVKQAVRVGSWSLLGLAGAVFVLGLLTFYMLFALLLHGRRLDLLRLRALGATPGFVLGVALTEVLCLALVALAGAVGLNWGLLHWAEGRLGPALARVGSLPEGLLRPNAWALAGVGLGILVVTLLPAAGMLRGILRQPVAGAIRDM